MTSTGMVLITKYVLCSGAGKTGIDAVLFLLNQNVDEDKILWIMPNDAWMMNRDTIHPDVFNKTMLSLMKILTR